MSEKGKKKGRASAADDDSQPEEKKRKTGARVSLSHWARMENAHWAFQGSFPNGADRFAGSAAAPMSVDPGEPLEGPRDAKSEWGPSAQDSGTQASDAQAINARDSNASVQSQSHSDGIAKPAADSIHDAAETASSPDAHSSKSVPKPGSAPGVC